MLHLDPSNYIGDLTSDPTGPEKDSPITEYFIGKTVFLTGGTGCMGHIYLEKMLRIGVKQVYLLIRPKKLQSPEDRLQKILEQSLFTKLWKQDPLIEKKIKVVEGNMEIQELGLTNADLLELINNVEIVVHAAADIRFDISLFELVKSNLYGTNEILQLAKKMKKLDMFAYISTAYSHCYRSFIEEKFYNSPIDPETMIKMTQKITKPEDLDIIEVLEENFIKPWPKKYTFTKALSEELVRKFGLEYPAVVIRPSIITATASDPIAGWLNNMSGVNGVVFGIGMGFIKTMPGKGESLIDAIAGDFVSNLSLGAMCYESLKRKENIGDTKRETKIYTIANGNDNPINLKNFVGKLLVNADDIPNGKGIWWPTCRLNRYNWQDKIFQFLYHACFGFIYDFYLSSINSPHRILPIYRKCQNFLDLISLFLKNSWHFDMTNTNNVRNWMTEYDKVNFPNSTKDIIWEDYFHLYCKGVLKYLMKDDNPDDYRYKKQKLLKRVHYGLVYTFYLLMLFVIFKIFSMYF